MDILFARHGNTFGPGDRVVWVGRETDLPLVARGEEQAREAAVALERCGLVPGVIYSGTLKRTRGFAGIVALALGVTEHIIDPRLDEVDYGSWAGKSSEDISALPGGLAALTAWQKQDVWPEGAGWGSSKAAVLADLGAFLCDLTTSAPQRPLVVSSNGILRFAPRLLNPAVDGVSYQLKTGALGAMRGNVMTGWDVLYWNRAPGDLTSDP